MIASVGGSIQRGVDWLARRVPMWNMEHGCASCHHQGDAALALLLAERHKYLTDRGPLAFTRDWCQNPERWSSNRGDPNVSDHRLAEVVFAFTLFRSFENESVGTLSANPRKASQLAMRMLIQTQTSDGDWRFGEHGELGSPITQGPILITGKAAAAIRFGLSAESGNIDAPGAMALHAKATQALERSRKWLANQRPRNLFEASSLILALLWSRDSEDQAVAANATAARLACRQMLTNGTQEGFGPYLNSPAENFDTGIALWALSVDGRQRNAATIRRAQKYLLDQQQPGGYWTETTRLGDVESYAHRVSTTAWVVQALIESIVRD